MRKLVVGAGLAMLLLCGCAPALSPESKAKIDPALDFAAVQADPEQFIGRYLLTGGAIVTLAEDGDGSLLELLRWRMTRWGEPLAMAESEDRIVVHSRSKLDGDQFAKGRLVTLIGEVAGQTPQPGNAAGAKAVRLELDEICLWDTPFRYGVHPSRNPWTAEYIPPREVAADHPYDPTPWTYPYTPYWFRTR